MWCRASPLPRLLKSFSLMRNPKVLCEDFFSTTRVVRETALSCGSCGCCLVSPPILWIITPLPLLILSSPVCALALSVAPRTLQGLWLSVLNWQHSNLLNLLTSARAMNWDRWTDHPNSLQQPDGIYAQHFQCDVISWNLPHCSYGSDYLLTCNFSY